MTTTTYYNLNIVEGTDIVNPLTVDNTNYEAIDEAMHDNAVAGVTLATEIANATVHAITRENSECAVIRFIATSEWKAGDTATVDGVPVTALLPSGETLPDGAYVINANVLCILTGTNLTIYAERKKAENANEITYNDTTVGAELVQLDEEVTELNESLGSLIRIERFTPTTESISLEPNIAIEKFYTPPEIEGYTAKGILGWYTNNGYVSVAKVNLQNDGRIAFCLINGTESTRVISDIWFGVLYVKDFKF